MDIKKCMECEYAGFPCTFSGYKKGVLQFDVDWDKPQCMHPLIDGAVKCDESIDCPDENPELYMNNKNDNI